MLLKVCQADSRCYGRSLLVDATFGLAIQNNNTDTPVNGGGGIIFNQTDRRSQAQYPFDLRLGHAARHTFLASRLGPVGGKLPVTVLTFAGGLLDGIGIPGNTDAIGPPI